MSSLGYDGFKSRSQSKTDSEYGWKFIKQRIRTMTRRQMNAFTGRSKPGKQFDQHVANTAGICWCRTLQTELLIQNHNLSEVMRGATCWQQAPLNIQSLQTHELNQRCSDVWDGTHDCSNMCSQDVSLTVEVAVLCASSRVGLNCAAGGRSASWWVCEQITVPTADESSCELWLLLALFMCFSCLWKF